jgi:SAM-dependent methyltransferase
VFTESAEFYDAIYFTFKDYASEAGEIARRIRSAHPDARTILDVACGTGEHARLLATNHGFEVEGIDLNPDFVRLAQAKNPAGRFRVADMVDFDLGQQYDAVICMFSSIGYVRTLAALEQTLRCFRRHTRAGGVILVEPWFPPEKMRPGEHSTQTAEIDGIRVERTANTEIDGRLCRLRFDYAIDDHGVVRHASELHDLGLFTEGETIAAFAAAGLDVVHEAESPSNRGLYVSQIHA